MIKLIGSIVILLAISTATFAANNNDSRKDSGFEQDKEIMEMKGDISEIKKELKRLKLIIDSRLPKAIPSKDPARQPKPVTGTVSIEGDPSMGSKDAPLVLVEFSDFQCPFCARFNGTTLSQIREHYIDKGKLRHVFKDFPLPFHRDAQKAAEAAHCAGEEGKYWEMHDLIFTNQRKLSLDDLTGYAGKLGLNGRDFKECLDGNRYASEVRGDLETGKKSGITGTPAFVLGRLNKNGEVEGRILSGAQPYVVFKTAIDAMLKK